MNYLELNEIYNNLSKVAHRQTVFNQFMLYQFVFDRLSESTDIKMLSFLSVPKFVTEILV